MFSATRLNVFVCLALGMAVSAAPAGLDSATNLGVNADVGQLLNVGSVSGNTQTSSSASTPDISSILSQLGVSVNVDGSIDRRELLNGLGSLGSLGAGAGIDAGSRAGFDLNSLGVGDLSGSGSTDADTSGTSTSTSSSGSIATNGLLSGLDLGSLVGINSNLGADFAADKRQITNALGFGGNVGVGSGLDINSVITQILNGNLNAGAGANGGSASDGASISVTATGTATIPTGTISLTPTTATAGASTTATANTNGLDLNSIISQFGLDGLDRGNFGNLGANANVGANGVFNLGQ